MAECKITVNYNGTSKTVSCSENTILLNALEEEQRELVETPCGGKGICGKCKVKITAAEPPVITDADKKKLTKEELEAGYRLACVAPVTGDMEVTLPDKTDAVQILESGIDYHGETSPCVEKQYITMTEPNLDDQVDDYTRITSALEKPDIYFDLKEMAKIPELLREHDYKVTAVYNQQELLTIEGGDTKTVNYGIAVDIGTTTVVAYLIDLDRGKKIDVTSGLNKQKQFGQDVISRINHTMVEADGLHTLQTRIIDQLNELIETLISRNSIDRNNIYSMSLVGNTTMIHLALGLPPRYISTVPFIPVSTRRMIVPAGELGLNIAPAGRLYIVPALSGYIGADIISAVLASEMYNSDALSLLIDIGTNGEIVLGNKDHMTACSTAAGPAFEGATIRYGVGGINGAINSVAMSEKDLTFTTIGNKTPVGMCGSGIVDTVSTLLYLGIIDTTGRMVGPDEIPTEAGKLLADRLTTLDDKPAFIISPESESGGPIMLTQGDVREVQNGKAAIAAGITTLIKYLGKKVDDIDVVYLAGGFGNYIDRNHAVNTGLIPEPLENKIKVIGNAAGSGAITTLLSKHKLFECDSIVDETKYIELSSSPEFQEDYVNSMFFGEAM
jgi:uncharacterized 2Fe-2S/4Fe-4S cluster protein (DUF4445 family)